MMMILMMMVMVMILMMMMMMMMILMMMMMQVMTTMTRTVSDDIVAHDACGCAGRCRLLRDVVRPVQGDRPQIRRVQHQIPERCLPQSRRRQMRRRRADMRRLQHAHLPVLPVRCRCSEPTLGGVRQLRSCTRVRSNMNKVAQFSGADAQKLEDTLRKYGADAPVAESAAAAGAGGATSAAGVGLVRFVGGEGH